MKAGTERDCTVHRYSPVRWLTIAGVTILALLSGCAPPDPPIIYERIVIDTYKPKTGVVAADTFISLFGPAGDPTWDADPWGDPPDYTVDAPPISIAEDDDSNSTFFPCARIDYTEGLASGTYYVRVRGKKTNDTGVYAVRVLSVAIGEDIENYDAGGWYFLSTSDDASYETDDDPESGRRANESGSITIGGKLNRAITTTTDSDVDWLKLTLP